MDVKAALICNDHKAILNSFDYDENVAVNNYNKALGDNLSVLNAEQQTLLHVKHVLIKTDHDKVKRLRDMLV